MFQKGIALVGKFVRSAQGWRYSPGCTLEDLVQETHLEPRIKYSDASSKRGRRGRRRTTAKQLDQASITAKQAFGGIFDAIMSGRWDLAADVAMAGLEVAYRQGLLAIRTPWSGFKEWLIGLFADMFAGIFQMLADFQAKLVGGVNYNEAVRQNFPEHVRDDVVISPGGRLFVGTPAVWMDQGAAYGNELERHRSLWTVDELQALSFELLDDGTTDRFGNQMLLGVVGKAGRVIGRGCGRVNRQGSRSTNEFDA